MRLCLPSFRKLVNPFLISFIFITVSAHAGPKDGWDEAASGNHSMRSLGSDFWVDVPVKRVEGARLILFNHELATRLGLEVPEDPGALEKLILDHFAWTVAKEGEPSERKFLATRYQDSNSKAVGEALGDGRAFWTGEIKIPMKDGRILYVDFTAKGVGQTPLAWLNHSDPLHKDGLQSTEEAVHSFTMSEINLRNQLDTVGDLAVIELPMLKMDKHTKLTAKASMTIRVGTQTRIAHYRYFADEPKNFKKIFEYAIKRDLGLPLSKKLDKELVNQYLNEFSENMAREAARYYDLHAVHASPTAGNRTTRAATIDLGTFRYLDSHHTEYSYLFDQLKLEKQTEQLETYVNDIYYYAQEAKYPIEGSDVVTAKKTFRRVFKAELTNQWLHRLGLDEPSIAKVPVKLRDRFFSLMKRIHETLGKKKVDLGGDRVAKAAAYEPREILRQAVEWQLTAEAKGGFFTKKKIDWTPIFKSKAAWATPGKGTLGSDATEFGEFMEDLLQKLAPTPDKTKEWVARAEMIGAQKRLPPGRGFYDLYEAPALEAIRTGKSLNEISEPIFNGIDALVDLGLERRVGAHLKQTPRIAVFSGTFDPPHRGHEEFLTRVMEAYQLDQIYVVANLTSDHKSNVTPYELRKEMTKAAFSENDHILVADADLENAFRLNDMNGVLNTFHQKNPTSELIQIMGDDSFERLRQSQKWNPFVSEFIVNPRSEGVVLPAMLGKAPVLNAARMRNFVTSSTQIRKMITAGSGKETAGLLKPEVLKIIQRAKLYIQGIKDECKQWLASGESPLTGP